MKPKENKCPFPFRPLLPVYACYVDYMTSTVVTYLLYDKLYLPHTYIAGMNIVFLGLERRTRKKKKEKKEL